MTRPAVILDVDGTLVDTNYHHALAWEVRDAETEEYAALIDEVRPLPGAIALLEELERRGCRVVLASSAKEAEIGQYVGLLGAQEVPYTTSADVESRGVRRGLPGSRRAVPRSGPSPRTGVIGPRRR